MTKVPGAVRRKCSKCGGSGLELDPAAVGRLMAAWRDDAKKTQEEVATALGVTAGYISDLERGMRNWTEELIEKYNAALQQ